MAKVLGQSARYVSQQAVGSALAILGVAICTGTGFFGGFLLQNLAFTSARVEAIWGKTGNVHCM